MSHFYTNTKTMTTFYRSVSTAIYFQRHLTTTNSINAHRNQRCIASFLALAYGPRLLFGTVNKFAHSSQLLERKLQASFWTVKHYSSSKPAKHQLSSSLKLTKEHVTKQKSAKTESKKVKNNRHGVSDSMPIDTQFGTKGEVVLEDNDVSTFAADVIKRARTVDVMASSVPQHQVEGLILGLRHLGFKPSDILHLLSTFPVYLLHQHQLLPNIHLLMLHGLDLEQVREVMFAFPGIVKLKEGQLNDVADALRCGSFREKSLAKVIAGNPDIFLLDKTSLIHRITKLRELFKSSDVVTVIINSPHVLTNDWGDIQALFDYVFHEMKVTQKQMVYASLFSHSLQHVKSRHAFLVRAGLFDTSKRRDGEKSPNVRLDQIIDTSDDAFCARFGQFDVQDYHTFYSLYKKERDEQKNDTDSDEE